MTTYSSESTLEQRAAGALDMELIPGTEVKLRFVVAVNIHTHRLTDYARCE